MKRALLISGLAAAVMAVVVPVGLTSGELDLPGLNQRIDNIDARTTNNEQDIQKLQESTQTSPAEHGEVPPAAVVPTMMSVPAPPPAVTVNTPSATSAPTVAPTPAPTCPPSTPIVSSAPGIRVVVVVPGGCR